MHAYIFTVLEGPDIGRTMELQVGTTFLGRQSMVGEESKVYRWTFIDKTVSRTHAEIYLADPGVPILRHLSGTNDTYVDGRKVTLEENLQPGQVIRLGQTILVMETELKRNSAPPRGA